LVGCGTANRMQSETQSLTRSFAAVHMVQQFAFMIRRATRSKRTRTRSSSKSGEFCFLPRNLVASFPYKILNPYPVMPQVKLIVEHPLTSEQAITHAKQVAQECAMKAAYYRRGFTQQAWRETIVAALLVLLGLILLLRVPAAGFFLFMCGAVAARAAYTSFQCAFTAYGEYEELG